MDMDRHHRQRLYQSTKKQLCEHPHWHALMWPKQSRARRTKWIHSGHYRMNDKYDREADDETARFHEFTASKAGECSGPSVTLHEAYSFQRGGQALLLHVACLLAMRMHVGRDGADGKCGAQTQGRGVGGWGWGVQRMLIM